MHTHVNNIIGFFGNEPIQFMGKAEYMWQLAVISEVWKEVGWSSIIYLAALTSIDTQLYEAAMVDGAGKFRRIWHISLPGIKGTIAILLILKIGSLFASNFDQLYLLGTPPVRDVVEVIDTYVYRASLQNMQYSFGTAVGFFKSVINVALVLVANQVVKKTTGESLL